MSEKVQSYKKILAAVAGIYIEVYPRRTESQVFIQNPEHFAGNAYENSVSYFVDQLESIELSGKHKAQLKIAKSAWKERRAFDEKKKDGE